MPRRFSTFGAFLGTEIVSGDTSKYYASISCIINKFNDGGGLKDVYIKYLPGLSSKLYVYIKVIYIHICQFC